MLQVSVDRGQEHGGVGRLVRTMAEPCFLLVLETMAVNLNFILKLRRRHWRL